MNYLTDENFDPGQLLDEFSIASQGAGGIVSFLGTVRPESGNGVVQKLHLQAYAAMTEIGIQKTIDQANQTWPLMSVKIVHRVGDILANEPIVFVATAARHRRAAFEAADFLMDYLKTKAIFWKKETTSQGEVWIEPRSEDYEDAERWNNLKAI